MIEIIPTCIPKNAEDIFAVAQKLSGFSRWVHIDINDGKFTPKVSWPYGKDQLEVLKTWANERKPLPSAGGVAYEVHLMVRDSLHIGELMAAVGCSRIIGHIEAFRDEHGTAFALERWKQAGALEVGLAILLKTPLSALVPHVGRCDVLQIMSIATIGAHGAPYESHALSRVEELHAMYPGAVIEVDGGINESNICDLARAGAQRFAIGSAITKVSDSKKAYEHLKALAQGAL